MLVVLTEVTIPTNYKALNQSYILWDLIILQRHGVFCSLISYMDWTTKEASIKKRRGKKKGKKMEGSEVSCNGIDSCNKIRS